MPESLRGLGCRAPVPRLGSPLVAVLAAAFAVRLVYALALAPDIAFLDDDAYYHGTANALADGEGYVRPIDLLQGRSVPTAEHPPLYPALLALLSLVGLDSVDAHRLVNVVVGTLAVLAIALVARRLAGDRAALAAAAIAAVLPSFVAADGSLMSEPVLGLLVALAVLQALRAREAPTLRDAALLGVLLGLCTLARTETLLLLPLLLVPVAVKAPRRRVALAGVAVLAAALVLAPWVVRNWTTFDRPVLSTNDGTTLAGSNCPRTYRGPDLGWFVFDCALLPPGATGSEAERSAELRRRGLDHVEDNAGRAVLVAGVRVANLWGLYKPSRHNVVAGRHLRVQQAGVVAFYLVALLAIGGLVGLRRRRAVPLAILLAPLLAATLTAAVTYGSPRLRHGADVILVALAGAGLAALAQTRLGSTRRSTHSDRA